MKKPNRFYIVFNESNSGMVGIDGHVRSDDHQAAKRVAQDVAKRNPGTRYHVMESVGFGLMISDCFYPADSEL